MRRLHEKVPEYRYRESSLFPTDVSDRANDWEAGLFREFQSNPELRELVGESGTDGYCLSSPSVQVIRLLLSHLLISGAPVAAPPATSCAWWPRSRPIALRRRFIFGSGWARTSPACWPLRPGCR